MAAWVGGPGGSNRTACSAGGKRPARGPVEQEFLARTAPRAGSRSRTSPRRKACHTAAGRPSTGTNRPSLRWDCQAATAFSRDGNESAVYTSIENLAIVWAPIDRLDGRGAALAQAGYSWAKASD